MRGVDAVMRHVLGEEQYFTACYAHLNRRKRRLSIVSAGHPPMILVSKSGTVTTVEMDSEPIGIFSSLALQRKDLRVSRGDRLFLYSDGLIESTPGSGRQAGLARLVEACQRRRTAPLALAPRAIAGDVRAGAKRADDDLLLLAVEALP